MNEETPAPIPASPSPAVNADLLAYVQRVHGPIGRAIGHAVALQAAGQPETTWRPLLDDVHHLLSLYCRAVAGKPLSADARTQADVLTKRIETTLREAARHGN